MDRVGVCILYIVVGMRSCRYDLLGSSQRDHVFSAANHERLEYAFGELDCRH
jgi:hypothetical protein